MALTKLINIEGIQPTQDWIDKNCLVHYSNYNPKLEKIPLPEVITINNQIYLFDGHHRTLAEYLKNKKEIKVNELTQKDYLFNEITFNYFLKSIIKRAEETKERGIYHIKDLRLH